MTVFVTKTLLTANYKKIQEETLGNLCYNYIGVSHFVMNNESRNEGFVEDIKECFESQTY